MSRLLVVAVLLAIAAPARAQPSWSIQLGESVGFENGQFGVADFTTTDLRLARRVTSPWWLYLEGRAGDTVREGRLGALYLVCRENDLLCGGFSAGLGYERQLVPELVEYGAPPEPVMPTMFIDHAIIGDGRVHLRIGLARDFPIAIEFAVAARYVRLLDGGPTNGLGVLASAGLVARM